MKVRNESDNQRNDLLAFGFLSQKKQTLSFISVYKKSKNYIIKNLHLKNYLYLCKEKNIRYGIFSKKNTRAEKNT